MLEMINTNVRAKNLLELSWLLALIVVWVESEYMWKFYFLNLLMA